MTLDYIMNSRVISPKLRLGFKKSQIVTRECLDRVHI